MLCDQELHEFFAHVEELSQASQDSVVTNHFQSTANKYQEENIKLRSKLIKASKSTREVLEIFKNEQVLKNKALQELEDTKRHVEEMRKQCEKLQIENVNQQFSWKEKFDELDDKNQENINRLIELGKDYLEVLSETTIMYSFEIEPSRNKLVKKTENFLKSQFEDFEMPDIITRRGKRKPKDKIPVKRTRKSETKEEPQEVSKNTSRKRRKFDHFDMQSISEVASPASFYDDETASEIGSNYTFNTFSIGNETSYSLIENKRKIISQNAHKCRCHEEVGELVSIGVDTEDLNAPPLPSVPLLDVFDFDTNEIACSTFESDHQDVSFEKENEEIEEVLPVNKSTSIGTNTEISTSDKSTATVHSTTTRGTSTPQVVSKNFGMQYPEINYEKIFAETIFELPDCLDPIDELENLIQELEEEIKSTTTQETQTNLMNVCREIDYVTKNVNSSSAEEQSFTLLGKSVFNIFLERLRKSNKSLNDEASARERLWSYMQQQFFDRFDELTFDDYFNPSFLHESDKSGIKDKVVTQEKENYEETFESNQKELKEPQLALSQPIEILQTPIEEEEEEDQSNEFAIILENIKLQCLSPPAFIEPISSPIKDPDDPLTDDINEELIEEEPINPTPIESLNEKRQSVVKDLFEDIGVSSDSDENTSPPINRSSSCERSPSPASIIEDTDSSDFSDSEEELNFKEFDSPMSPLLEDRGFEGDYYIETPKSPPPFARKGHDNFDPIVIPFDTSNSHLQKISSNNPLEYRQSIRQNLVMWQQHHVISNKKSDKLLCKFRKSIQNYLDSEWSDENLEICLKVLEERSAKLLLEAIYETVEDNDWQTEINLEFTPPAPPLPRYQQKLIVLIKKLTERHPKLPHMLVNDLETKLFKFENKHEVAYLRNMAYYYTSLIDLFFEGNSSTVFYFIVKCIYFYTFKAIPMTFVLIKAFPNALPKKSTLLKKYSTNIDWDNMTGLELSKIRLDLEWVDSLDLTVIYLLTSIQMYRKKDPDGNAMSDHELFNYLPKFYGFPLNFIAAPKLLDVLMKRFEDGEFTNLSFSLILLAKRTNADFTIRTLIKGKLLPFLHKLIKEISEGMEDKKINQICILIDVISSILKALSEEKDKSVKELFPFIVNTLGRAENVLKIQECCIRAILRLQRLIDNHKEIYDILEKHYENRHSFSESLTLSITTFIHRKNEIYFKK